jgi:hypothetical protein
VQNLIGKLQLAAEFNANQNDEALAEKMASAYAIQSDVLGSVANLHIMQREPISSVLQQLMAEDGLMLIANWTEMASQKWNPNVQIPWESAGRTNQKTLQDLTNSMNLAYRMLKGNVIEITSKEQLKNATRIEVFPCHKQLANNFPPQQIIKYLKEGIASSLPDSEYTRVDYVPQYKCIVALLPDPLLIQTEKILNQLADSGQ